MRRPDGCTCGRGPADGSHLPGCPVVPFQRPDAEAPAPISSETGAVSAVADHSSGGSVPSAPVGVASPPDIHPTVEAAGAADAVYGSLADQLALVGLVEHIRDLHRELGDLPDGDCPFVRAVLRQRRTAA